jgi:hypothetical protein
LAKVASQSPLTPEPRKDWETCPVVGALLNQTRFVRHHILDIVEDGRELTVCVQGVFTYLLEGLGAQAVQFEELFALDADYLKQLRYIRLRRSDIFKANPTHQSSLWCNFPLQMAIRRQAWQ